jgi:hypothetical protein
MQILRVAAQMPSVKSPEVNPPQAVPLKGHDAS